MADVAATAHGDRTVEASKRFYAVLLVNEDRIPIEVVRALHAAFTEYTAAWAEFGAHLAIGGRQ